MSLDQDIALLATVGLFQGFSPDQLRLIAFGAERERFRQGEILFREGEAAGGGYVVVEGQIDLMVNRGRRQMMLETAVKGGLIGEMALMTPNRRASEAVARMDSELLYISRPLFHRMLGEYPETAAFLRGRIAQSVRRLMGQLEDVHGRLGAITSLRDVKALADTQAGEPDEKDQPDIGAPDTGANDGEDGSG